METNRLFFARNPKNFQISKLIYRLIYIVICEYSLVFLVVRRQEIFDNNNIYLIGSMPDYHFIGIGFTQIMMLIF